MCGPSFCLSAPVVGLVCLRCLWAALVCGFRVAPLWVLVGSTAPLWLAGGRGAWRCWANSAGK